VLARPPPAFGYDVFAHRMPRGFAIMATTAEIKTGSRRTISYLLFPLLRYKQEALRER
jgi:hypothetical protein